MSNLRAALQAIVGMKRCRSDVKGPTRDLHLSCCPYCAAREVLEDDELDAVEEAKSRVVGAARLDQRYAWQTFWFTPAELVQMLDTHFKRAEALEAENERLKSGAVGAAPDAEGMLLERLSDLLTGGNAATWEEILHAAETLAERDRQERAAGAARLDDRIEDTSRTDERVAPEEIETALGAVPLNDVFRPYGPLPKPAMLSSIAFIERCLAPRRCDHEAVSECVRCNAVAVARWLKTAIEHIEQPRAAGAARLEMTEDDWDEILDSIDTSPRLNTQQHHALWSKIQALKDQVAGAAREPLEAAVRTVLETFKRDETQGYRSRDRQYAIAVLEKALASTEPLPEWWPSGAELLRHVELYRALSAAVDALDPAAADDQPYGEWDAAKWAVFNAAVKLVKESKVRAARAGDPAATPRCKACEQGLPVMMLDDAGTRTDISKRPGVPSHGVDDAWWPCALWTRAER